VNAVREERPSDPERLITRARVGWWPRLARLILRAVLGTLFRIRLVGDPPERGPYILAANHQGWSDAFLIIALFPAAPRIYFIGDQRATMTVWWKRFILNTLGVVVPVKREGSSERDAIERSLEVLAEGAVLGIFPEGRVSRTEASLGSFHRGIGYLAARARAPVLPVWLRGTGELYLGRALTAYVGALHRPPEGAPTKQLTSDYAGCVRRDFEALALPWTEPAGVRKRLRWLTDIL